MICGVDESGRGPFIGPLVMAAVSVKNQDELPQGLKDSKLLTKEKREEFFKLLQNTKHVIKIISVQEIDEWVNQGKLNWLEAKYTIEMLNKLKPKQAIIDCPHKNIPEYENHLKKHCSDMEIKAMFKADQKYPVVSAASILAKVTRDNLIEQIKKECNVDFGSGYLTDPKTQKFLETVDLDFPHLRKSWKTYEQLKIKREQKTLL